MVRAAIVPISSSYSVISAITEITVIQDEVAAEGYWGFGKKSGV
jgi:hypothetical protein